VARWTSFEGLEEDRAHQRLFTMAARTGRGEPPTAGRRSSRGHRLGGRGASWSRCRSLSSDSRIGGGQGWPAVEDTLVEVDDNGDL
jgi:hypothetical protein